MRPLFIFFISSCIFLQWSCWNQEFDHRKRNPVHIEHNHDHSTHHNHDEPHDHHHDHDHHDHSPTTNQDLTEIVSTLEDKERVIWQKPSKVIEMLGDIKGKTIADIGAGTGYFSFRMANEGAKVIPLEIDDRLIHYMDSIKKKLPEIVQERIDPRLTQMDDPMLSANEVDGVILVNTYIYIQNRINYFKKVKEGMKSGGKLLIVDYKKKKLPMGQVPPKELRLAADSVEMELEAAGYRLMETDDTTLDYQYIILVTKP